MNATRYALPAILLHWVQAVLVVWLLWLGWTMVDLPKGAERSAAYGLHKSLGLLMLMLVVVRIAWRGLHPVMPVASEGWEARLATLTHRGLYVFLLLAPLAGYLASSFTPYPLKFFGLVIPKAGFPDEALNGLFKLGHQCLVWGGAVLIGLHIAGALKHLWLRDGTVQRMLPKQLLRNGAGVAQ